MMKMTTSNFVTSEVLLPSKEWQEMPLVGLDSNSISLTGFGQIQTYFNPHLLILYKTSQIPTSDPRTQAV